MPFQQIKKNLNGRFRVAAEHGTSSQKLKLVGQNGKHAVLNIPLGIDVVHKESGDVLHKCNKMYQRYLIAKGGAGGNYRNNYKGEPGEELNVLLHLKLRPNIGLVGLPNAGKSTILQAFIPKKSVKIAAYPFTTLKPQLGFWKADDDDKTSAEPFVLSLADLPGLIDGAADNRGRGHEFMKHLEYADILLIVVDCTGFQMGDPFENPWRSPLECVGILNAELENYLKRLVKKPCVVVLNKTDLVEKQEVEDLKAKLSTKGWHKYLPEALQPKIPIQFDAVTTSSG
ncbi:hypothetical protein WR25_06929 [Diploscapter pachys]|uniref:OBG-type G domain-containing protein n=1 Tax=Diploscapter pachys TaxID=2018661 RepID=A0A2A2L4M2_9BILA|nr:hypothetical protein WR25_06929 [Diploscapter pachys]